MEYVDKKILELRELQKKQKYSSLDTGIYIKNEIIEFERVDLFDRNLSLMLPKTFVTLPSRLAEIKYQSGNRPQIIKSSLDTAINFTFSLVPCDSDTIDMRMTATQFKAILKQTNPAYEFYDFLLEDRENGSLCWFDYKSFAIDSQIYNIMYVTLIGKKLLHGCFNCCFQDAAEWKSAARQVILSIWDQTSQARTIV